MNRVRMVVQKPKRVVDVYRWYLSSLRGALRFNLWTACYMTYYYWRHGLDHEKVVERRHEFVKSLLDHPSNWG